MRPDKGMSLDSLHTSAHFRANLCVLDEAAAQAFSKWAASNCSHHVLREESGATVLYATRASSKTSKQHRNNVKAFASNKNIKLNTNASFLILLRPEEYEEAIAHEALAAAGQTTTPDIREVAPPMCCKMEMISQLNEDFHARAQVMLEALVAADAR